MTPEQNDEAIAKALPMLTPEEFLARFGPKTFKAGDCWVWTGWRTEGGYGWTRIAGQMIYVHRLSFVVFVGEIPADKPCVLHSCDNPPCWYPGHLWAGTLGDNNRDSYEKGRHRPPPSAGSSNGRAKLTDAQVIEIRARYAVGDVFQYELAEEFGLGQTTISQIVRGDYWQGVEGNITRHSRGRRTRATA